MHITLSTLSSAAGEIRQAEAVLSGIIADLSADAIWSGADADRFASDWNDEVRAKLLGAANALDSAGFTTHEA